MRNTSGQNKDNLKTMIFRSNAVQNRAESFEIRSEKKDRTCDNINHLTQIEMDEKTKYKGIQSSG